jgi:hypothetical protein
LDELDRPADGGRDALRVADFGDFGAVEDPAGEDAAGEVATGDVAEEAAGDEGTVGVGLGVGDGDGAGPFASALAIAASSVLRLGEDNRTSFTYTTGTDTTPRTLAFCPIASTRPLY